MCELCNHFLAFTDLVLFLINFSKGRKGIMGLAGTYGSPGNRVNFVVFFSLLTTHFSYSICFINMHHFIRSKLREVTEYSLD